MSGQGTLAGYSETTPNEPRQILMTTDGAEYFVGGGVLDASTIDGKADNTKQIRSGTYLAKHSTSGKWFACKSTTVSSASGNDLTVVDSRSFAVGDSISVDGAAAVTITAINYDTDVITVSGGGGTANDTVKGANELGIARVLLSETITLQFPGEDSATDRAFGKGLIAGYVNAAMLLGDSAAIRADTASKINTIKYSDDHQ